MTTARTSIPLVSAFVRWQQKFMGVFLCWTMLLIWSFSRCLIPSVNEPHYLCKARSYWQPTWCERDFFLASSNPHQVFYQTVGWLTTFCTFETTAILFRLLGLLILAIGWTRIGQACRYLPVTIAFSLSLFLLLQASINFSGEWLVGGIESKVFAYGFGFWAIAEVSQNKRIIAGLLLGLAIAFHPLVGLWLLISLTLFQVYETIRNKRLIGQTLKQISLPAGVMLLASLPGLIPALSLLIDSTPADQKYAADYLQVYYRLGHHLDPMRFAWWRYLSYALMSLLLVIGYRHIKPGKSDRMISLLFGITAAALIIAFVGVLIGLRGGEPADMPGLAWRVKLLKFYPFRLFDMLLPVAAAFLVPQVVMRSQLGFNQWISRHVTLLTILCLLIGLLLPFSDHRASRMSQHQEQDWISLCKWIEQETPENALFVTSRSSWAFKWFAQRAEYVNFKDCPQDAAGIVEWNRRLKLKVHWVRESYADSMIHNQDLLKLAEQTNADYLVTGVSGHYEDTPVYENNHFRLFALPETKN